MLLQPIIYTVLALVFWIPGLYFFVSSPVVRFLTIHFTIRSTPAPHILFAILKRKKSFQSSNKSPAQSRNLNMDCKVEQYFSLSTFLFTSSWIFLQLIFFTRCCGQGGVLLVSTITWIMLFFSGFRFLRQPWHLALSLSCWLGPNNIVVLYLNFVTTFITFLLF